MPTIASLDSKIKIFHAIIIVALIVETVMLTVIWNKYQHLMKMVPYDSSEQAFVNKAIYEYAKSNKLSEDFVMKGRFPVTSRTNDGLCVSLRIPKENLGFVPVYCFDSNGKLVFHKEF